MVLSVCNDWSWAAEPQLDMEVLGIGAYTTHENTHGSHCFVQISHSKEVID